MPHVLFTPQLQRSFPGLDDIQVGGSSVAEVIRRLDALHPGLAHSIVDDAGALRQHVNVFIGRALVRDRVALSDEVGDDDDVYIFQAQHGT